MGRSEHVLADKVLVRLCCAQTGLGAYPYCGGHGLGAELGKVAEHAAVVQSVEDHEEASVLQRETRVSLVAVFGFEFVCVFACHGGQKCKLPTTEKTTARTDFPAQDESQ